MFYTITVKKFWVFKLRSQGAKLLFGQTILPCTKSPLLSKYPEWILVFTLKGLKGRRPSKIEVSKSWESQKKVHRWTILHKWFKVSFRNKGCFDDEKD